MCRDKSVRAERCACDTSEARQKRRLNAKARSSYAPLVQTASGQMTSLSEETIKDAETPYSAEQIRSEIANLHDFGDNPDFRHSGSEKKMLEYNKRLQNIGMGIEYLAENKYGAPQDHEIREKVRATEDRVLDEIAQVRADAQLLKNTYKEAFMEADKQLSEVANRTTHPIIRERVEYWQEHCPEIYARREEMGLKQSEAQQAIWDAGSKMNQVLEAKKELFEKRNEAVKQALEEVGVVFADPSTLNVSADSHKKADKSLRGALKYYPQEWIDNSNKNTNLELRIKDSKGRAHYSGGSYQKKYVTHDTLWVEQKPDGWKPDRRNRDDDRYSETEPDGSYTDPKTGVHHSAYGRAGQTSWVYRSYSYKTQEEKPKGRSWEKREYENYRGEVETVWRRPNQRRTLSEVNVAAELTVTNDQVVRVGTDKGFRVALHEFGHRVEATTPIVTNFSSGFLSERAGIISADGEAVPEQLTSIYTDKSKIEYGYKDSFPNHYMGKIYRGSVHKEILSMGMESLFAGTQGGFAGIENFKPDPQYKRFIIGVLASSATKRADN